MQLNFNSPKPIYLQMVDEVKRALVRGELMPGDKIPSHKERAEMSQVNPNTVQRAYQEMERVGLTETLRGQGTFVRNNPTLLEQLRSEMAQEAMRQFIAEMRGLGIDAKEMEQMLHRQLAQEDGEG
ncbi:GntR family transcriptional regulator [Paenibacillus sp. UNCCL117]|uniref:GntR family transcriptional regulator n=1 Tax=unclassified Paenibacillus TaxID=185978 RepID=UPI00088F50F3|nr:MULTISPECIES: GntR family transcriptional regulator [unclassified Paenibacillus]SDE06767.1 GntR family transcriptional regulator [Paenibacillus sp. cl123]SFW59322.1 GntR family transcriptional regulator [Paenibacillus sp. UNCCL117]